MTWFKVDDHLHSHPKTWAASLAAMGLWSVAGSWSSDQLTDGFIPEHMAMALSRGQIELADELVLAGLWERTEKGYQFHEWDRDADGTIRNPTRAEAIAGRRKMSSGGELGNHRRWHEGKGKKDPACRYCRGDGSGTRSGRRQRGESSGGVSGSSRPDTNPMPERPVDNSHHGSPQGASDQDSYRVPDRGGDTPPESPPNPPSPVPSQSRPRTDGGTHRAEHESGQSVRARARVNEALRWLRTNYGLTDTEAITAWKTAEARAKDPVRTPVRYLERMAQRGHLADIVSAIQTAADPVPAADPDPPAEPEPPPLRAINGNGKGRSSDAPATHPPLFPHAVPDAQPDTPAQPDDDAPLYDPATGQDHRTAAPLLADLKRKWSTGT